jgi:hypothetical protein
MLTVVQQLQLQQLHLLQILLLLQRQQVTCFGGANGAVTLAGLYGL